MIRVAINGFGRIGRALVRAVFEHGLQDKINIVHINTNNKYGDLVSSTMHLLQYDTIHGKANLSMQGFKDYIVVEDMKIGLSSHKDPSNCPWQDLNVDIVLECTGKFKTSACASKHLDAGAKQVLISAPGGEGVERTVVYGVNHKTITATDRIISNASCTTNCLAPLVMPLEKELGITSGIMTTIHAYTSDQSLLDNSHRDLQRARAAALSMIPASTGAAKAIGLVIPELKGKLVGQAVRVPVANVSLVDLTVTTTKTPSIAVVNKILTDAAKGYLHKVLDINTKPLVSIDFNHNSASAIADLSQTQVCMNTVKVMAWYDNEWAFACRMLDMVQHMAQTYAG